MPFDFYADTFSYPNELVWEYRFDATTGQTTTRKNDPSPQYAHHCFVVVRSARQFYLHARWMPDRERVGPGEYVQIIRKITRRSPSDPSPSEQRIAIPGFSNLREFSAARADLLRQNCGGAWQSYIQRGNWRMIVPFSRGGQSRMAAQLQGGVSEGRLPIAHVATFPSLTINHVVMLLGSSEAAGKIEFQCYDPNICAAPITLTFDRSQRRFIFPRTHYFPGGPVNVYEIYRGWCL